MKKNSIAVLLILAATLLVLWRSVLEPRWGNFFSRPSLPVHHRLVHQETSERMDLRDLDFQETLIRMEPSDPQYWATEVYREHLAQYLFAAEYSQEHGFQSVADIASGTCYGMEILRKTVAQVDGYDKEDFCGNYVLDLDKEDWGRQYDAIISFETIEHLTRPEFFLENAARSAPVLILSTMVNEPAGQNEYHLSHWTTEEFQQLIETRYDCKYLHRNGLVYEPGYRGPYDIFTVCHRRDG